MFANKKGFLREKKLFKKKNKKKCFVISININSKDIY
jgi:hypothetical protein